MSWRLLFFSLALVSVGAGCAGAPARAESIRESRRAPVSYLPGDLDVALRIDLEKIRSSLPLSVSEELLKLAETGGGNSTEEILASALARGRRVWLAFRPGERSLVADFVVIVEGDFSRIPLEHLHRAFSPARDIGAGVLLFEGRERGARSTVSRLYSLRDELWIFATEAELDAIERTVEQGVSGEGLHPDERGLASLELRVQPLLPRLKSTSGKALAFFQSVELLRASVDLKAEQLRAHAELRFTSEESAQDSVAAFDLLLRLLALSDFGLTREQVRLEQIGRALVIETEVSPSSLGRWRFRSGE